MRDAFVIARKRLISYAITHGSRVLSLAYPTAACMFVAFPTFGTALAGAIKFRQTSLRALFAG